jgi:histone deacetylase 1/2
MDNANTLEYLEKIKNQVIDNIRRTMHKPSVQMTDIPNQPAGMDDEADATMNDEDEDEHMDTRHTARRWDLHTEKEGELSESEDEEGNARNGIRKPRNSRRRNIMDYQNANSVPDDDEIVPNASSGVEAPPATNGDLKSGHGSPTPPSSHVTPPAVGDDDVEMTDEPAPATIRVTEGPQGATPPDSPTPATDSRLSATNTDSAMGDAADAVQQGEGIAEREQENATAEQTSKIAAESEK